MNSKLLYAATVAVSLLSLSTFAMAGEAPLTRAEVNAELAKAKADGTLQRTDYDSYKIDAAAAPSHKTRTDVIAETADAKAARKVLKGPDADRNYNQYGTEPYRVSVLSRAEVKAEVQEAAANGTLQRTDYDDPALVARNAKQHAASATFAQRVKAKFSGKQS